MNRLENRRRRTRGRYHRPSLDQRSLIRKIGFVENDQVRGRQLTAHRLAHVVIDSQPPEVGGIDEDDDQIEPETPPMAVGRDPGGIGHPAGLDEQPLGTRFQSSNVEERTGESIGHAATHASVGQGEHLAIVGLDERGINVDFAKVVDQNRRAGVRGA